MLSKYLVAVSGGPDSMALLDRFRKQGHNPVVAHVNYSARDTALRDQKIVEKYCKEYNLTCVVDDSFKKSESNFQSEARLHRYKFFTKLCKEHNLEAVLIGHHEDDVLETYLFQKERGSIVDHYGLLAETSVCLNKVIRPLLKATKVDLIAYLDENGIEYGIDETNFDSKYSRFKYRQQVNAMSSDERQKLLSEMNSDNNSLRVIKLEVDRLLRENLKDKMLDLSVFENTDEGVLKRLIFKFLAQSGYPEEIILGRTIDEVISFVNKSTQGNASMDAKAGFKIQLEKKKMRLKHPTT